MAKRTTFMKAMNAALTHGPADAVTLWRRMLEAGAVDVLQADVTR